MARPSSEKRAQEVAGGFSTAKKNLVIQFEGRERTADGIYSLIKRDLAQMNIEDEDVSKIDVYVKPEEHKIYYVVNKTINGQIDF